MIFSDLPSLAEASIHTEDHGIALRRRETGADPGSSRGHAVRDHAYSDSSLLTSAQRAAAAAITAAGLAVKVRRASAV